jgi:hypothetical protein
MKGAKGLKGQQYFHKKNFDLLIPALKSKAEELSILGYGKVEARDIWNYFIKKRWKNQKEDVHIYELVSDILSLKAGDYMNFAAVEAYRSPNWFADLDSNELEDLLNPKKKG